VVGSTGAGKTTLVDVILGLLRPSKGEITIDEVTISDEQVRAWQQSIGYVPQDIFLADASIAENIAFGIPPEEIDHAQVESCARMAQIHEFIVNNLSEQYRTSVGERGVRLSGGQRQRLGIARALYNDPELMVFDEATSALDTTTENAVMDAIEVLAGRKTIIIIAHRLNTVRSCDFIVLLDQGAVKAKGTYSELMERDHQFKLMVNSRL
jgi:ABC-type multidrug transport system fused ATPase/permease subunit